MRRRILSLARHSLRAAVRSRVVVSLLLLLATVALILPRSLRGDGTPASDIRMLLTWTLGTTVTLLAAASLWAGCSAVATDVDDGSFVGVVVTPVRPLEHWLGKWLGLVALNAMLLAAVLGIVAVQLLLRGFTLAELQPDRRILPSEESLAGKARLVLSQAQAQGRVPPDRDPGDLLREIHAALRTEHASVNPGETHQWRFDWSPRLARRGADVRVRLELLTSFGGIAGAEGQCRVLDASGTELASAPVAAEDGRNVVFSVPADNLRDSPTVTVVFENTGTGDSAAVLVGAAEGATLLAPTGSFPGNLIVAGFVLWAMLAALTAVGVTVGTMFSLPVAVFAATAVAILGLLSHAESDADVGCGHDHSAAHSDTCEMLSTPLSGVLLRGVAVLTQPIAEAAPLDRLGDRIRIDSVAALRAVALVGVALPLLFALVGATVLRRREFP